MSASTLLIWQCLGLASAVLMIGAITVCVQAVWQRPLWLLLWAIPMACLYVLQQSVDYAVDPDPAPPSVAGLVRWVTGLPVAAVVAFDVLVLALLMLSARTLRRLEHSQISAMSVKEATDSLPSGLCFYLPGGRIVLSNRSMETLCRTVTGGALINGERFRARLAPDASPHILPDGSAWTFSERTTQYEGETLHMLLATDVTELHQKNTALQEMHRELDALNERLTDYLREIVTLSTRKEILAARVRLHDELGADLLVMQRYIREGSTGAERAALEQRLRRNISFLNADSAVASRDEYQLLMQTAERLNAKIIVEGPFPETEPHRHILVTAIHECFTNTLRHARGDCLRIRVEDADGALTAVLTNNGVQPEGPIRETGGLASLRRLTEQAGGRMTVSVSPAFSVRLELPKEVTHAPQRFDRG